MTNILNSVKDLLAINQDETSFDNELLTLINTYLIDLTQLGIGKSTFIVTSTSNWEDFITLNNYYILILFVYLNIKLVWDLTSLTQAGINAIQSKLDEITWRITNYNDIDTTPNTGDNYAAQ